MIAFERKRRAILIREKKDSAMKTLPQSHVKPSEYQTPRTQRTSIQNVSGRPSDRQAPYQSHTQTQYNKPNPVHSSVQQRDTNRSTPQTQTRTSNVQDRSGSGRRIENAMEIESVNRHITPRASNSRQPFGTI
jgi:hypothetical protein